MTLAVLSILVINIKESAFFNICIFILKESPPLQTGVCGANAFRVKAVIQ